MIRIGTVSLSVTYMALYIAVFVGAIGPWLTMPVGSLVGWTLLQIIGTILFFTIGLIGAVYAATALVKAVREAEPKPTKLNSP